MQNPRKRNEQIAIMPRFQYVAKVWYDILKESFLW